MKASPGFSILIFFKSLRLIATIVWIFIQWYFVSVKIRRATSDILFRLKSELFGVVPQSDLPTNRRRPFFFRVLFTRHSPPKGLCLRFAQTRPVTRHPCPRTIPHRRFRPSLSAVRIYRERETFITRSSAREIRANSHRKEATRCAPVPG